MYITSFYLCHGGLFVDYNIMSPFLQEKKRNNLKDFLNVAGPMGVTHFLILSKTATAPYLRVATTPQGPTLTFKIHEYSLAADIAKSQLHPRCPKDLFKNSALVKYSSLTLMQIWQCSFLKFRKEEGMSELLTYHYIICSSNSTHSIVITRLQFANGMPKKWDFWGIQKKDVIYYTFFFFLFTFYPYQVEGYW